ncbi:MAG: hypothetical protein JKX72_08685 [Robiginitomaculum sp.]|nr:hypothetical protein [Robiginitomaculum sp.]
MKFKLFSICIMSILLSGCVTSAYFYDDVRRPEAPNQVNIYQDFIGDIYPTTGVNSQLKPKKKHSISVRAHLKGKLCDSLQSTAGTDVYRSCQKIDDDSAWRNTQEKLWKQKANIIYDRANKDGKNRPIVFLIHGFRFDTIDARTSYAIARDSLSTAAYEPSISPLFVNIYWDGFQSSGLGIVRAWGQAQASGPLVGYNLRFLMNELESKYADDGIEPAIRVLTHSSGAFVIGAIIGDPSSALPLMQKENIARLTYRSLRYFNFKDDAKSIHDIKLRGLETYQKYGVPQFKDFRIGLLAAATPSNTFTDEIYPKRCGDDPETCRNSELKRMNLKDPLGILNSNVTLLLGFNPKENGLTKFGLLSTKSSLGGASGLGADGELQCLLKEFSRGNNQQHAEQGTVHPIDMRRNPPEDLKSHDFNLYLTQKKSALFYDALMDKNINDNNKQFLVCTKENGKYVLKIK